MGSEISHPRVASAVTLMVLVALLVVGAVVGFNALFAPLDDEAGPVEPTCTPQPVEAGRRITTSDVTVSVYNASDRSGLANDTLTSLAGRGFRLGEAGNAPVGTEVSRVQVWASDESSVAARLVARQFGKGTGVVRGEDLGPGVEVIVGRRFQGLAKGAPKFLRSRKTQEVCVPSG